MADTTSRRFVPTWAGPPATRPAPSAAVAYATGNDVAFAQAPDLFTAAHEAAHVVQQRAGVQLKGGIGQAGDHYERHADSVADLVVQGKSAEPLLDSFAGSSSSSSRASSPVQRVMGAPPQLWVKVFESLRGLIGPLRQKRDKTLSDRVTLAMWDGFFDNLTVSKAQLVEVAVQLFTEAEKARLGEVIEGFQLGMGHGFLEGLTEDIRAILEIPGMLVSIASAVDRAEKTLKLWGEGQASAQLGKVLVTFTRMMQQADGGGMSLALLDAVGDIAGEVASVLIEQEVRKAARGFALNLNRMVNGGEGGLAAAAGEFGRSAGKAAGVVAFNVLTTVATAGGGLAFAATRRAATTVLTEMHLLAEGLADTRGARALGAKVGDLRQILSTGLANLRAKAGAKLQALIDEFLESLRQFQVMLQGPEPALASGPRLPDARRPDATPDNAHAMEWASDGERQAVEQLYGDDMHVTTPKGAGLSLDQKSGSKATGATRLGVKRTNTRDWRKTRDLWDATGYGDILSAANREAIAAGRTPVVDEAWLEFFPGDAHLLGEKIPMHHIQGTPITVPLPETRHRDAHMPGGFRYNPGGPGRSG